MDFYIKEVKCGRKPIYEYTSYQHPPKWMVMGSIPLYFETIRRNIASVRFSTLFCAVSLFMILFSQCGEAAGGCNVDECSSRYQRSNRRLDREQEKNPLTDLGSKRCRVAKKLHRCLHKIRRVCRGNLLYHSIKHINDMAQKKYDCPRKPTLSPPADLLISSQPFTVNVSTTVMTTAPFNSPRDGDVCRYLGSSPKKHCGMFGDPHLRTFSDAFNTCKIEGTWPLIDNDYMVVMVTNVLVEEGSPATVSTKITVVIKAAGQCAGQRHYVATSEQLPGAFTDGSSTAGSVEVVETDPGKRVEIRSEFIGTTVIIRQVSRYLTFAIRIPEEFVSGVASRTQLCVEGCPENHQLRSIPRMQASELKRHDPNDEPLTIIPSLSPSYQTNRDEMKLDKESKLPQSVQYYTEKKAREKCRQILLDLQVEEVDLQEEKETSDDTKNGKKPFKHSSSLSSSAFSSLVSSPIKDSSERNHRKMAPAHRPDSDVLSASLQRTRSSKSKKSRKTRSKRSSQSNTSTNRKGCSMEKDYSKNSNFYFDSCVFDLITTGDIDFTLAAKAALDDVRRTHIMGGNAPGTSLEVVRLWEPVSRDDVKCADPGPVDTKGGDDPGGSASSVIASNFTLILCLLFSCVNLNLPFLSFFSAFRTVNSVKSKEAKYYKFQHYHFHAPKLISSEAS